MKEYPEDEQCNPHKCYDGDPLPTYYIAVEHIQIIAPNCLVNGKHHKGEEHPVRETLCDPQWEHDH